MNLTRIYTGSDSESHFETLGQITLEEVKKVGQLSKKFEATGMIIHHYSADFEESWQNPPLGRVYVIFLEGEQEIEVGNGEKRIFRYGDILLIEDLSGRGHRGRAIGGKGGKSIIITLD